MTRLRQQITALDNVIRTDRFDGQRNRQAKLDADYASGLAEINAPVPGMEQLRQTRGPDPISADVAWIMFGLLAGVLVGVLGFVVKFRVWEYLGGVW